MRSLNFICNPLCWYTDIQTDKIKNRYCRAPYATHIDWFLSQYVIVRCPLNLCEHVIKVVLGHLMAHSTSMYTAWPIKLGHVVTYTCPIWKWVMVIPSLRKLSKVVFLRSTQMALELSYTDISQNLPKEILGNVFVNLVCKYDKKIQTEVC